MSSAALLLPSFPDPRAHTTLYVRNHVFCVHPRQKGDRRNADSVCNPWHFPALITARLRVRQENARARWRCLSTTGVRTPSTFCPSAMGRLSAVGVAAALATMWSFVPIACTPERPWSLCWQACVRCRDVFERLGQECLFLRPSLLPLPWRKPSPSVYHPQHNSQQRRG